MFLDILQQCIYSIQTTPSGPVVECFPGVLEPSILPGSYQNLLKWHLVLPCKALGIKRLDQGNMVSLSAIKCDWMGYQCTCDKAFRCGSTIHATSKKPS